MGKIFVIIGKSSSGKDTIFKRLLSDPDLNLKPIVTYTTRPRRTDEVDGREYFFVDNKELEHFRFYNLVIESREYKTSKGVWTYFTVADGQVNLDKNDYLYIGTLVSYKAMKRHYGEENVFPIYIEAPDNLRLIRAIEREFNQNSPDYSEVCRRFLADEKDFSEEHLKAQRISYHDRFKNLDLYACIESIKHMLLDQNILNKRVEAILNEREPKTAEEKDNYKY